MKISFTKRSLLTLLVYCAFCGIVGAGDFSYPQGVYNGEEGERATFDNGGKVNKAFLEKMALTTAVKPEIVKVTDGVWTLTGYHWVYATVIEGDTGLI